MATQHMVKAIDDTGALQRPQIADLLNHHDQAGVAPRVLTDRAWGDGVECAAGVAFDDLGRGVAKGRRQRLQQVRPPLEQRQGRLARRARPQPRQARQQGDQPFDLGAC